MPLNRKYRDRLDCLRRRRDYLTNLTTEDSDYRGRDWDLQEAASLAWAIAFIEKRAGVTP